MKKPKLYLPKKSEVATLPEKKYDPFETSYKGVDSRAGRLKDVSTDRGVFRIKDNFKE